MAKNFNTKIKLKFVIKPLFLPKLANPIANFLHYQDENYLVQVPEQELGPELLLASAVHSPLPYQELQPSFVEMGMYKKLELAEGNS